MNRDSDPILEVPFTYLLPMREDDPAFADFKALRDEITDVMGEEYPSPLITRIKTMLAGNGVGYSGGGVRVYAAQQDSGSWGSVRAVTFEAPLSIERLSLSCRGIGPVAARALVSFAVRLQVHLEEGPGFNRGASTYSD